MKPAFNLRLNLNNCHDSHHQFRHFHQYQQLPSPSPSPSPSPLSSTSSHPNNQCEMFDDNKTSLKFSVINILRPDFGRKAIINTKSMVKRTNVLSVHISCNNSVAVTGELSPSSTTTRLTSTNANYAVNRDTDSFPDFISPLRRHSTGLSRSGSLESLVSNHSSVNAGSPTGTPSLSSAASTIGTESISGDSSTGSTTGSQTSAAGNRSNNQLWPAWVYCTRYSDRPSSGPRTRRIKRSSNGDKSNSSSDDKRPRTAFSSQQLARLKREFTENRYLTERRRQQLSRELSLNEAQIKIWFQNKRAKIKKASGQKNPLALQLMAQGLYNHSTVPVDDDGEEIIESEIQTNH